MIAKKYVRLGLGLAVLAACCVFWGMHWRPAFIGTVLAALAYAAVDRKWLRCPECGAFINLDRLFYAVRNVYHCHRCGVKIHVK